jgi:AraC-like DNA-binding protein
VAEVRVRQLVRALLATPVDDERERARGGLPPMAICRAERLIAEAMDLLRQPDLTVADVSDAAGYSSPAYFIASFRQQLGVTPRAYQPAVAGKG